jgi:hypothetical protein
MEVSGKSGRRFPAFVAGAAEAFIGGLDGK